jgi:membrane protein DedA with SNARE-associated domain
MHEMIAKLIDWYTQSLQTGGYPFIVLLMAMESSIVPLPSEAVIPVAAHLAHTQGHMSVTGVVIAGAVGSWVGAAIMYWGSRIAGRPLVLRYGKYFFISPAKVAQVEQWFMNFGSFGTFVSRFVPVVRHLIGIPAGIARMKFLPYSIYTFIGSAMWCGILAWVGVKAGQDENLMKGELHSIVIWLLGGLFVLGSIYYFFVHRQLKAKQA